MRFAYADPPYPGQAARWYSTHPDYAGEVNHAKLIQQLADFDGWALSTSAAALQFVLSLCPPDVRVAAWTRPNSEPPDNRGTWHWTWEPVIVKQGRAPLETTRDALICPHISTGSLIPGQKPRRVCEWIFRLMGASIDDELADLFPGSGAVTWAWHSFTAQPTLF